MNFYLLGNRWQELEACRAADTGVYHFESGDAGSDVLRPHSYESFPCYSWDNNLASERFGWHSSIYLG